MIALGLISLLVYLFGAYAYGAATVLSLRQAKPVWGGNQVHAQGVPPRMALEQLAEVFRHTLRRSDSEWARRPTGWRRPIASPSWRQTWCCSTSRRPTPARFLARRLDPAAFFQVSRATFIHLDAVREARPFTDGTGEIVLTNGQAMPVARRRWRALIERLEA